MTKKYGFGSAVGDFIGAIFAVPTYGASLTLSPTARDLARKIIGSSGEDDSTLNNKLKEWEIKNDQWKAQMDANKAEVERLRQERKQTDENIKRNDDEIARLRSIINNPYSTDQEKENAKKRIVILETENEKLKRDNKKKDEEIAGKSKMLPVPTKPWSLPKLSYVDKALIAGGVVLLVYLLIPNEKKK